MMSESNNLVRIGVLEEADVQAAVGLYASSARDALTSEERAEQGFTQGRMSPEMLAKLAGEKAVFAAKWGGQVVGVTMLHPSPSPKLQPSAGVPERPAPYAMQMALESGVEDPVLYGPSVVAKQARGHGVLSQLLKAVEEDARVRGFKNLVAFMELENVPSIRIHDHLGFTQVGTFTIDGRDFQAAIKAL